MSLLQSSCSYPIITTTRFDSETWNENVCFREKHKFKGCIYNKPCLIQPKIKEGAPLFVIEMNNTLNRVEGIGLIINKIKLNVHYHIHNYEYYNIYTYKGKYRIDRTDIEAHNIEILKMLDIILFKGRTNVKRGAGFVKLSDNLLNTYRYDNPSLIEEIKDIFIKVFKQGQGHCINKTIII
jgi:hypothetical protein